MYETDETIYSRFLLNGKSDDLRILLERHRESLTLFLYGYVHSMEDAEELMMDAFAVAAAGTSVFSGKSSFKTWLFGIGRNLAKKHLRQKNSMLSLSETAQTEIDPAPEQGLLQSERRRELYAAIAQLPADYRQALYLLYIEDMSCEEAARVMHKSKKQVYNLVFRGKKALKEQLERNGFVDAAY